MENLNKFIPEISKVLDTVCTHLKQQIKEGGGTTKINIKDILKQNFIKIFTIIVFGDQEEHNLGGRPAIEAVSLFFELF